MRAMHHGPHLSFEGQPFQRHWPLWQALAIVALGWLVLGWPWLSGSVAIPWDAIDEKLTTAVASGNGPDILQIGLSKLATFAEAGRKYPQVSAEYRQRVERERSRARCTA